MGYLKEFEVSFSEDQTITAIGVESVVQTQESTEDNGVNTLEVTLTDGTKSEFNVRNGSQGSGADAVVYTPQDLTPEQQAQARENIGISNNPDIHAEYFTITDDGVLSLKPEYRGALVNDKYPYGVSDNGVGVAGSKNSELPEIIVIPEVVNEIAVTTLPEAMFGFNAAVKSITIPHYITEIPRTFARDAVNLHTINGTENVKTIGTQAFYSTRIKKANFPKLEGLNESGSQFQYCSDLIFADVGSKITTIPKKAFYFCEKLSYVHNGESVNTVGESAFNGNRRLKTLSFLPNLKQIDANGFRACRIDYDWASLADCTFGTNATVLQCNPTDFWSACTFTPCNTPLRSVFAQNDPRWAGDKIGNSSYKYEDNGCVPVSASMVYSVFENKELSSPKEFVEAVKAVNPSLMDLNPRNFTSMKQWLEAVGYTVTPEMTYTSANLQTMYNALASGALVLTMCDNGATTFGVGHCILVHGINENGEVLIQDPMSISNKVGVYECAPFAMHIQNLVSASAGFIIVTKN